MGKIRTHYDNLQVARNASPEVIRAAYKGLTQRYHPDRNPNERGRCEWIMKLVNRAFEVLSDPQKRAEHDAWIATQEAAAQAEAAAEAAAAAAAATSQTTKDSPSASMPNAADYPAADHRAAANAWRESWGSTSAQDSQPPGNASATTQSGGTNQGAESLLTNTYSSLCGQKGLLLILILFGFYPVSTDGWVKSLKARSWASSRCWMNGLWKRSM